MRLLALFLILGFPVAIPCSIRCGTIRASKSSPSSPAEIVAGVGTAVPPVTKDECAQLFQ